MRATIMMKVINNQYIYYPGIIMLDSLIGISAQVKTITLSPASTLLYLAMQTLDIAHDCAAKVDADTLNSIAYLQTTWIIENNTQLQKIPNWSYNNLYGAISKTIESAVPSEMFRSSTEQQMRESLARSAAGELLLFRNAGYTATPIGSDSQGEQIISVVDSCPSGGYIYCERNHRVLTASAIYDQGAWGNVCSQQRFLSATAWGSPVPAASAKFLQDYIASQKLLREAAVLPHTGPQQYQCDSRYNHIFNGDVVIKGHLLAGAKYVPAVIAYRGCTILKEAHRSLFQFHTRATPSIKYSRGRAPSNKQLGPLFSNWLRAYQQRAIPGAGLSREDRCVIYSEFCAKHWGDFGMVCEAAGTQFYVISQDKYVPVFCEILKVNFADAQFRYAAPARFIPSRVTSKTAAQPQNSPLPLVQVGSSSVSAFS